MLDNIFIDALSNLGQRLLEHWIGSFGRGKERGRGT